MIRLRGSICVSVHNPYASSEYRCYIVDFVLTASWGEILPSGTTEVASTVIAPTPLDANP